MASLPVGEVPQCAHWGGRGPATESPLSHGLRRDSSLGKGALGIAVMFPAKVQSLRTRQLRPLRRSRASSPKGGAKP